MNLRNFRRLAHDNFGLTPAQVAEAMRPVYKRGDRTMGFFVLCHLATAFLLASVYGTWWISIPVALAATSMFFASVAFLPGRQTTRFVAGISLQVFVALHIYQMHGLPEMHFYFFTAQTMLIVYEDYLATWPGTILIILQHLLFAVLQNAGLTLYFFPDSHIHAQNLVFHIGIALAQVAICSYWAILQKSHRLLAASQSLELEHNRQQSEQAAVAKTQFLANMSHEIRTPMNSVLGLTEILLETRLSEEQREFSETIQSSGQALLTILDDVLDLSKIEAGGIVLEPLDYSVHDLVEETAAMLAPKAAAKHLDLLARIDPAVPLLVKGDPTRLRQILLNLAGNAIKFTETGHVLIDVSVVEQLASTCRLRFTVEDTGIGIAEAAQAGIFDRFTQADASTTRRFGGTGLGLSISQALAQLMGGRISLSSTPGRGSRFEFTLELPARKAALGRPYEDRPAEPPLAGFRVLLLEPRPVSSFILCEMLTAWGAAVTVIEKMGEAQQMEQAEVLVTTVAALDGATPPLLPLVVMHRLDQAAKLGPEYAASRLHWLLAPVRSARLLDVLVRLRQPNPAAASGARPRVLVAEDNPASQRVATAMLQQLGYTVDVVADGEQAIAAWRGHSYDAILMDCRMPGVDGFAAATAIREQEGHGHRIPIIALTAHITSETERSSQGMDGYLSKPVSLDQLRRALEQYVTAPPVTTNELPSNARPEDPVQSLH